MGNSIDANAEVERLGNALKSALADSARLTLEVERLTRERDALLADVAGLTQLCGDNTHDGCAVTEMHLRAEVEQIRAARDEEQIARVNAEIACNELRAEVERMSGLLREVSEWYAYKPQVRTLESIVRAIRAALGEG